MLSPFVVSGFKTSRLLVLVGLVIAFAMSPLNPVGSLVVEDEAVEQSKAEAQPEADVPLEPGDDEADLIARSMVAASQVEIVLDEPQPVDVGKRVVVPDGDGDDAADGGAFFVQFGTKLTDAEIEELQAAGANFGQALRDNTYIVRLDEGASRALAAHRSFVGLTPVVASDKSASEVLLDSEAAVRRGGPGQQQATVEFFADVELVEALAAADAAGVTVPDRSSFLSGNRLTVVGSPAQFEALASFSGSLYLSEPPGPTESHNLTAQQLSNVDDVQATGLTGAGVTLGIWDGGPALVSHGDFGSRVTAHDFYVETLTGAAEVPGPGDVDGGGVVSISLQGTTLEWYVIVHDVGAPTAAHIHSGAAGQSGGIFIPLSGTFISAPTTQHPVRYYAEGTETITTGQAQNIRANPEQYYVNVHNAPYPNGAVRGQFGLSDYHATHVAGTMIGSGAGNASAEGMAPGVPTLHSYDFFQDTPTEMTYAADNQGVVATNSSFGTPVGRCGPNGTDWCGGDYGERLFGLYNSQARDWDAAVVATGLINMKSAGNDRDDCGSRPEDPDNCDGFPGNDGNNYDTISTYGNAKNVITVGAVNDSINNCTAPATATCIASFSSAGPSNDGRIKPDVVANGVSVLSPWDGDASSGCSGATYCSIQGTSMATPVVTGIVALLEERHRFLYGGSDLRADAAKAALANTAIDLGRPGPDYLYGYGLVDAEAAVIQLSRGQVQLGQISASSANDNHFVRDLDSYTVNVGAGTSDLRVTLNWLDPAGVAQTDPFNDNAATPAIVNQLDLTLLSPGGSVYYPFKGPGRANPTNDATALGPNRIDTLQQVRVSNPEAGPWTVVVQGWDTSDQDYAVVTSEVACVDDRDEAMGLDGDSHFFAVEIAEGVLVPGKICNSDVDYFKIPVVAGEEISVEALFTHADGDLDIRLYDPNGTQVGQSNGVDDNETITYTALLSGDYRVRVEGWQAAENTYDLIVWTGVCHRDDVLEDNDDQASATPMTYGSQNSGLICGTDADWFEFPVTAGDEIFAQALFTHPVANNINMRLFDPGGTEVAASLSVDNNESILHTAATSGDYAVRVYGFNGAETFYDFSVWNGICAPDDLFEANNTQATAVTLTNGKNISAILCDGDFDWFKIFAAEGEQIDVDAVFSHIRGDLDMKLFDPSGAEVESSGSETDNESITHVASMLGHYAVRIAGFGTAENIYDLTATTSFCPPDDAFENNDTQATATVLTSGVTVSAIQCGGDFDWFELPVAAGESITIETTGHRTASSVGWSLYDPNGNTINVPFGDPYTYTPLIPGDYAVEVFCCGPYDITLTAVPVSCPGDDAFEQNDNSFDATPITSGVPLSASAPAILCGGDDDWFEIPITTGADITVEALFTHADGNLDLELWDPNGSFVTSAFSLDDNELILHTAAMSGDYAVRVNGFLGFDEGNLYDLIVTVVPICPPDDAFEENDSQATAAQLTSGVQVSAVRCPGDDDWFKVSAVAGYTITADALFTHADGDLEIELLDPDGWFVDDSDTSDDNESLVHQATKTGDYAVRVSGNTQVLNRYDLTVTAGFVCPNDDAFEDNDSQNQAELLTDYSPVQAIVCGSDDDWFELYVPNGFKIVAEAAFTHADGDLVLEMYDPTGAYIGTSQTVTDNEGLNHTATMSGDYAVRISRISGIGNSYELTVWSTPILCPWGDDFHEENDSAATAALWTAGGDPSFGTSCPGDDDWFKIPVAAGEPIVADLRFNHFAGNLALELLDPNLAQVGFADTATDVEILFHTAALSGDYLARVVPGSVENDYSLRFVAGPPRLEVLGFECVVYDSASASAAGLAGTMSGGDVRTVQVTGELVDQGFVNGSNLNWCVPEGASAVVFRVSSINPLTEGNLRMTPEGVVATGGAGVVNYGAVNGLNNANTVTVPVSLDGAVDIQANAGVIPGTTTPITDPTTDVRLVAIGYYWPGADSDLKFHPVNPCAVADSRTNKGADLSFTGPNNDGLWPVGSAFPDVQVVGDFWSGQGGGNGLGNPNGNPTSCGVPATADAVLVNIVAVNTDGGSGHLSVGTGGFDPIDEATTPFAVLTPKMNNGATTIVNVGLAGTIAIDVDGDPSASTMIRVEVLGYYDDSPMGLDFYDVPPCAAFDSRPNKGALLGFAGERKHGPAHTTTYQIAGAALPVGQGGVVDAGGGFGTCGVPVDAEAVLINLEAVNALREGNFWVSAAGTSTTGGVLNFNKVVPKMNNANAVVVPLSDLGKLDLEINAGQFTTPGTTVAQARGIILGYYD